MDLTGRYEKLKQPGGGSLEDVEPVDFPFGGIYQGPRFADAAGLLFTSDGRILLALRAGGQTRQGTWALPGGWVEEGETPLQAAVRESQEELGIRLSRGSLFLKNCKIRWHGVLYIAWLTRTPVAFRPQLDRSEHTQYRWFLPGDLAGRRLHEGAEEVISNLAPEFLEGR
jgi:mutator protein MutT